MIKKMDSEEYLEKFWKEYGTNIKLGIIEDHSNRSRLAKLVRFSSSNSEDSVTSLADYIERMKDKQEYIYFMAGGSRKEVQMVQTDLNVHSCTQNQSCQLSLDSEESSLKINQYWANLKVSLITDIFPRYVEYNPKYLPDCCYNLHDCKVQMLAALQNCLNNKL